MKLTRHSRILLLALLLFSYGNATEVKEKNEFGIMQNKKMHKGSEVSIERKSFTIVSPYKEFAFVISRTPIKTLDKHKEILKLIGTGEALSKGNALLYKKSKRLDNYSTCRTYYGNLGEGCETYIKQKVTLGFKDKLVYTFGAFYIEPKKWLVKRINEVKIGKRKEKVYYLYLFKETTKVGEVAVVQQVTRMKINIK